MISGGSAAQAGSEAWPECLNVVHVWDQYPLGQPGDVHLYLRSRPSVRSTIVARRTVGGHEVESKDRLVMSRAEGRPSDLSLSGRLQARTADLLERRKFSRFLRAALQDLKPNIVHFHFGTTAARLWREAVKWNVPYVVTFYGVDISATIRHRRWRRQIRDMCNSASQVIVLCDAAHDRVVSLGCPESKVTVWNLPAGIELFEYSGRGDGGHARFLTAARFVEKKGYPILLQAFSRVLMACPDATLTAIGYGPLQGKIVDLIEKYNLTRAVSLIDSAREGDFFRRYAALLKVHDVFVLPSVTASDGDDEGGPALSMIAAQSAGLPVVCSPFPGAERSVIDGQTGFYCQERDPESLAEKMILLAENPELGLRLGISGSEHVRRRFAAASQVDELLTIYHSIARRFDRNTYAA